MVYELDAWSKDLNIDFTLKDCLFGSVKLTKNFDPDKYKYSGYGIGFDSRSVFSLQNFDWSENVIIFGVDMSSSVLVNSKKKNILIFDEGSTQGLHGTTLTAEAKYFINFTK